MRLLHVGRLVVLLWLHPRAWTIYTHRTLRATYYHRGPLTFEWWKS